MPFKKRENLSFLKCKFDSTTAPDVQPKMQVSLPSVIMLIQMSEIVVAFLELKIIRSVFASNLDDFVGKFFF